MVDKNLTTEAFQWRVEIFPVWWIYISSSPSPHQLEVWEVHHHQEQIFIKCLENIQKIMQFGHDLLIASSWDIFNYKYKLSEDSEVSEGLCIASLLMSRSYTWCLASQAGQALSLVSFTRTTSITALGKVFCQVQPFVCWQKTGLFLLKIQSQVWGLGFLQIR